MLFITFLLIVGVIMNFFGPSSPRFTTSIKRFCRLLLPLPLCLFLIGCEKQPANSTVRQKVAIPHSATHNNAASYKMSDSANNIDSADDVANDLGRDIDSQDEGQSLIAVAKPDGLVQKRRSPMISEPQSDSALQATLIGDYVGMLPCSFCEGVSVTLNLFSDSSILKTSIYENPEIPKVPTVEHGIYRQDNNIITIVYDTKDIENYVIQSSHLVMMDKDKNPNTDYTLARK